MSFSTAAIERSSTSIATAGSAPHGTASQEANYCGAEEGLSWMGFDEALYLRRDVPHLVLAEILSGCAELVGRLMRELSNLTTTWQRVCPGSDSGGGAL